MEERSCQAHLMNLPESESGSRWKPSLVVEPFSAGRDLPDPTPVEQALRRSEERSRREWMTIFQAIGHPTLIMDPEYRILQANQALCRMVGRPEKELIGKHCYELFHQPGNRCPPDGCPMRRMLVSGNVEAFEMEMEPLDRHFIVSCTPVYDDEGQLQKVIHIATDITYLKESEEEKKKLQNRLIQSQKMEAIGTLAGGIAHDFNNILMGLQGYISMFLHEMDADHPHRVRLDNMQSYIRRGADLTRQILGFARGGKYDVKPTDMNELFGKSADLFCRTRKEISVYRNFSEDLWVVDVDQGQMDQIFLNLFVNAAQAMAEGGNLELRTENIVFGEKDVALAGVVKGRYIAITVQDDGVGMDKKTLARIFEPFFTTKPKGMGSGLGLASAYGIVKNHGGAIHADSEPGKGTTIRIYLPASNNRPVTGEQREEELFTGRETILVVDDEPINISVMLEMLELLHYRVLPAGSGQEAVAIYMEKKAEIDLVIMDMVMPGISGGRTFDILREINPAVDVILASGYSVDGEARMIINRGCRGFIQKPFQLQELSRKVRETLDSRGRRANA
jgi:PAS domain S-box-containing protein